MPTQARQTQNKSSARTAAQPSAAPPQAAQPAPSVSQLAQAVTNPAQASPADLLSLQRAYGNGAVERLLAEQGVQAKLTVGAAGDAYELEADRVAAQVMRAPGTPPAGARQPEDERRVQRKPLAAAITPLVRRSTPPAFDNKLQRRAAPDLAGSFDAGAQVEGELASSRGGGSALPARVRGYMESRFGADFASVRVHSDAASDRLNRQLGAQAFTHGSDIYMGEGQYSPGTSSGRHLLAHELTHVVQQAGGKRVQRLISSNQLKLLAGNPKEDKTVFGKTVKKMSGKYKEVIAKLDAYNGLLPGIYTPSFTGPTATKVYTALTELHNTTTAYVGKHQNEQDRTPYVQALSDDIPLERQALQDIQSHTNQYSNRALRDAVRLERKKRYLPKPAVRKTTPETATEAFGYGVSRQTEFTVGGKSITARVISKYEVDEEKPFNTGSLSTGMKLLKLDGKWHLFKPAAGEGGMLLGEPLGIVAGAGIRKAGAVSAIADRLGINTPKTEIVKYNGELGSLQVFEKGKSLAKVTEEDPTKAQQIKDSQVMKDFDIFDYIIAQIDRHMGNFLIEDSDSGPVVRIIDNDAAMPPTTERFTPGGQALLTNWRATAQLSHYQRALPPTISRKFYLRLKQMDTNPHIARTVLENFLKEDEIHGYLYRLNQVMMAVEEGQIQVVRE